MGLLKEEVVRMERQAEEIAKRLPLVSLRDYFAGLAMQAYIHRGDILDQDTLTRCSYEDADAMLKERDKRS